MSLARELGYKLDKVNERETFFKDVLEGLGKGQKELLPKYFYDERGSRLFDQICHLKEYYLTRTEISIMQNHASEIADCLGPDCAIVELGSGSSVKSRLLLCNLEKPAGYVPVDICEEHMHQACEDLKKDFDSLEVEPVCADFTNDFDLPGLCDCAEKNVVYFPGSTIGNFKPEEARALLSNAAEICRPDGGLLIGIDLKKDQEVLEAAYNDDQEVTSQFNLNLLLRINRELDADFDLDRFEHRAIYNRSKGRIEMHLISRCDQEVEIAGQQVSFQKGETILTECSHKYTVEEFEAMAGQAGFGPGEVWTDPKKYFGVLYLPVEGT